MFNTEDILARLQKGENVDDIAKEMTAALNSASETYTKQKEEEKAKAVAAELEQKKNTMKIDYIQDFINLFTGYINDFHPNAEINGQKIAEFGELTDEEALEIAATIDGYIELLSSPFISMFTTSAFPKIKTQTPSETKVEKTPMGVKITGKGPITEKELDTPIDYDNLVAAGSMMGSGGMIVLDEDNCMVDVAKFYMEFIVDESCGKCTPCRVGTKRLLEMLTKITKGEGTMEMLDEMEQLCHEIKDTALCGLGQTAPNPILSTLSHFRDEYEAHILEKRCPAGVCKDLLTYSIDPDKCRKCSLCARGCPVNAISGVAGKEVFKIDPEKCIKCGSCMNACRFGAVVRR